MRQQAQRRWRTLASSASLPSDLAGQTAVIVGWGSIGRLIGEFLMALGMQIIVARHNPEPVPQALATVAYGDLATVLAQAQWLVWDCHLTAVTKRLFDKNIMADGKTVVEG